MENTTAAILSGLGTMLVVAAVVVGLVWLTYRLADHS
jgi:heme/copper-type cytochrome/quinol oxidase subunit 4